MRITVLAAVVAASATAIAAPASAAINLLENGSFEDYVVPEAGVNCAAWCVRAANSTPGWTQYLDGVDLVHNNYNQDFAGPGYYVLNDASHGVNFLDMNQGGAIGGLYQVVTAASGTTYKFSLDVSAWVQNGLGGTIGYDLYDPTSNVVLDTGAFSESAENNTWDTVHLSAKATSGSLGVRIYGVVATQAGMGADNAILTAAGGVPEPSTWALSILGFGLAGAALRRRGRAVTA